MRIANLLIFTVPAIWLTEGATQDSTEESLQDVLCEQCPYDAPVRPDVPNVFSPDLEVMSVRDMIDQLPNNIERPPPEVMDYFDLRGLDSERALNLLGGQRMPETASRESESVAPADELSVVDADSGDEESNADPNGGGQN